MIIKKENITMRKLMNFQRSKYLAVKLMNACALALAAYTINIACWYYHHQPEVPEDMKRFRKF
jgi:cyclic lactone autoinducer peptide